MNLYSYVLNNPLTTSDPLGLCGEEPEDILEWLSRHATESYQENGFFDKIEAALSNGLEAFLLTIGGDQVKEFSSEAGAASGCGNGWAAAGYGAATVGVIILAVAAPGEGGGAERAAAEVAEGAVTRTTTVLSDVTVISHGQIVGRGEVHLRPTLEGIESGQIPPRDIFRNNEGLLPAKPPDYYQEFVHPTPGVNDAGPQRIIRGAGGELYYTPDHYHSFTPLN
jgi:hypothetical protein